MVDVVAVVGSGLMVFLCVCVCGSVDGSVCVVLCDELVLEVEGR